MIECIVTYDDFSISNMIEYTYDNSDYNVNNNNHFYLSFCSYNAFLYYKREQFQQWQQMIDRHIEYSNHMTTVQKQRKTDDDQKNNGLPPMSKTFTNRLIDKLIKRGLPTHITDPIAFVVPKYVEKAYFDNLEKTREKNQNWDYNVELRDKKLHIPIKLARIWNVEKRDYDYLETNLNGVPTDRNEQKEYWQKLLKKIGKS